MGGGSQQAPSSQAMGLEIRVLGPWPEGTKVAQGQHFLRKRPVRQAPLQDADQRLSLPLPACTMRTIELTIIDRASLS